MSRFLLLAALALTVTQPAHAADKVTPLNVTPTVIPTPEVQTTSLAASPEATVKPQAKKGKVTPPKKATHAPAKKPVKKTRKK